MKNILLTNDDGFEAKGLLELAAKLRKIANVVIAAPSTEKSGSSQSLTLTRPLRFIKIDENLEPEERVIDFLKKVINPYFFNIDGYVVKFSYQENGVEAEECIHNAIKQIIDK